MSESKNPLGEPYVFIVSEDNAGSNLRNFLTRHCGLSRRRVREAALRGDILVNNQQRFLNQEVWAGERITLFYQRHQSSNVKPQKLPLKIIYEDADLLIVDKPANLVVHPTLGYADQTLANGISYYWQEKGIIEPVRIVTRLDQNTSGLVLVASNEIAHHLLVEKFKHGLGIKKYLALVEGQLVPNAGTIDQPIDYSPDSIIKRRVSIDGKPAISHYQTIQQFPQGSLVEVILETGRTHQIRVHLAASGHPIVGDSLYGNDWSPIILRQALHAHSLQFLHPRTGVAMQFDSPIPNDMQSVMDAFMEDK